MNFLFSFYFWHISKNKLPETDMRCNCHSTLGILLRAKMRGKVGAIIIIIFCQLSFTLPRFTPSQPPSYIYTIYIFCSHSARYYFPLSGLDLFAHLFAFVGTHSYHKLAPIAPTKTLTYAPFSLLINTLRNAEE